MHANWDLHWWRRCSRAQPVHQGGRQSCGRRRTRGDRNPSRLGWAARDESGRRGVARRQRRVVEPGGRADDRPHRRHDAPHVTHEPRPRQARQRAGLPRRPGGRRWPVRLHGAHDPGDRTARARRARPDRRRRHAVVRPSTPRRGHPGDRHSEDDGQRRPRHRLLHRILDRSHPGSRVRPRPPHVDRIARTDRGHRTVRALQRADVTRDRISLRRRPGHHLRSAVRRRTARRPV